MNLLLILTTAFAGGRAATPEPVAQVEVDPATTGEVRPGNPFTYVMRLVHSEKGPQSYGAVPAGHYSVYFLAQRWFTFKLDAGKKMELSCNPLKQECEVHELAPAIVYDNFSSCDGSLPW